MTSRDFTEPCPKYIRGYVEWKRRREEHAMAEFRRSMLEMESMRRDFMDSTKWYLNSEDIEG